MIRATLDICGDCERIEINIRGHSGYAEAGHDIVCAGVSALAMAVTEQLLTLQEAGLCAVRGCEAVNPGEYHLVVSAGSERPENRVAVMSTVLVLKAGLQAIARDYPEYMSFAAGAGNAGKKAAM